MKKLKFRKGFIATGTVLVLMIVAISIVTTVSLLGIGEIQESLGLTNGEKTLAFVEGCAESALLNARKDISYNGGTIILPEGNCTVTINSQVGNLWTMTVTTTATDYQRTIQVIFNRGSSLHLTRWKEV